MLRWAKHIHCLLHALNKCFERTIEASMGKQGLGTNSCIQLLYSSITMFRKIIVDGGLKLYDKYHNIVVETIMNNPEWQEEAGEHFMEQFKSWWSLMNGDDIDDVANILSEGMRNLQLSVFTCWHTIIPSVKAFIKNYAVVYFFCAWCHPRRKIGQLPPQLCLRCNWPDEDKNQAQRSQQNTTR